ncbi:MAG: asparagine synthase-related protein, partial [Bacteroidota bacterium]
VSNDSSIIAAAYMKWGEKCPLFIIGDYVFVIWDMKTCSLFCARDHIGARPFFYYEDDSVFIFSSEIKGLFASDAIKLSIRKEWIADTIATLISENTKTFYEDIQRLPPAHTITVNQDSTVKKKYWDLNPDKEILYQCEQDYFDHFSEVLNESVKCRTQSTFPVASELSGGLDSSLVTAYAFDNLPNSKDRLFALSHVLPDDSLDKVYPFKDERYYSHLLCLYKGIKNHLFVTSESKGVLNEMKNTIRLLDGIPQQRLELFSDDLYKKAHEAGCRTLLSGFGGDQLVSYSGAGYFEELAHHWKYRQIWTELKKKKLFYKTKKTIALLTRELLPFIYRMHHDDNEWATERFLNILIHHYFSAEMNLARRYKDKAGFPTEKSLKLRQYKRITHPHIQGRLESCSIIAKHYGLEYAYPLLDRRLMELYFSFPAAIKFRNGLGRFPARMAAERIIPEEIQWRQEKTGATIPTVQLRFLNDLDNIYNFIDNNNFNEIEQYVDIQKFRDYIKLMIHRNAGQQKKANPAIFFNALAVLVYQKMMHDEFSK